jgi:hypothetical protein
LKKEEIFYQAYQKASNKSGAPEGFSPKRAIRLGLEIAARLDSPKPRTPEQIYLANLDVWVALENESRQRQHNVRFKAGNQMAKNGTARAKQARERRVESENSTVIRFARQFGLARYRVEQIRRALRDCSNIDLLKMAMGGKSASEVLRYPMDDS